ncbi:hypothetical protein [Lentilitoribacter sp. Alg239-R112]|uniref:hypothetical protein n=1 Tax=Lentilitoribacter sp. Alg239-R112 TaxID=2305987 RepID=UPI0013A6A5C0|nr:hypothetical protein [Lentilitoribacter sp. Alg239-R112]
MTHQGYPYNVQVGDELVVVKAGSAVSPEDGRIYEFDLTKGDVLAVAGVIHEYDNTFFSFSVGYHRGYNWRHFRPAYKSTMDNLRKLQEPSPELTKETV